MTHSTSTKAYKGIGMEGITAKWYASITRKGLDDIKAVARRVADTMPSGGRLLEVAPGPGYFAIEVAKLGPFRVDALDISRTFVEIARRNAAEADVAVDFHHGNAADMPFADESFDFVFCRAAFKNFADPVRALAEMHRVLARRGRALIIDLRSDASTEEINQAVNGMRLGVLNRIAIKLTFQYMLLKRAYTKSQFEQFLSSTEFDSAEIKEDAIGLEVWARKK